MLSLLRGLGFPYPPYVLRILGRTVVMWVLLKMFFLVALLIGDVATVREGLLVPSFGVPALLVFIDRVRAHERLLLANLGASEWWLGLSTVATCLVLDVIVLLQPLA